MRSHLALAALLIASNLTLALGASDPDRDFSGRWLLDRNASDLVSLSQVLNSLSVSQGDAGILCSAGPLQWSYALDGSETRKQIGQETRSSIAKWEGAALLINTQVSGPQNYTEMDRWELSRSHNVLTVTRQVVTANGQAEGTLLYRREGTPLPPTQSAVPPSASPGDAPPAGWRPAAPANDAPRTLTPRPEPGVAPDVTVPSGTRVLLSLIGEVNTKHAKEGDHVYLRTASPVAMNGRVVIPRGSDVQGAITRTKPAGKIQGKGELFIRFDSLILPNGVSRDFRARPPGEEGKVEGNGKSADGRTVMEGAGMGATIGAITRGLPGAGVGGGIGALAGVLLSRNQDIVLRPGTQMEMVLDRDLVFRPDELQGVR
jgi:type IV secretion system protein VirB10